MADSWWNTSYSLRRSLNIVNNSIGPIPKNNPVYIILDFTLLNSLNKVRDDFQDVEVLFWDHTLATPSWVLLAHNISFDSDADQSAIVFNTVYEIATQDITNYFLYFTNPSLKNNPTRPLYESAIFEQVATPENGGIMFSRPGEDWVGGESLKSGARAAFTFYGTDCAFVFESNNDKGIIEMVVNDENPVYIDAYNNGVAETSIPINRSVGKHYVRVRSTGDKNPSSSGSPIKIVRVEYSKYFRSTFNVEEIHSVNEPFTIVIGI